MSPQTAILKALIAKVDKYAYAVTTGFRKKGLAAFRVQDLSLHGVSASLVLTLVLTLLMPQKVLGCFPRLSVAALLGR